MSKQEEDARHTTTTIKTGMEEECSTKSHGHKNHNRNVESYSPLQRRAKYASLHQARKTAKGRQEEWKASSSSKKLNLSTCHSWSCCSSQRARRDNESSSTNCRTGEHAHQDDDDDDDHSNDLQMNKKTRKWGRRLRLPILVDFIEDRVYSRMLSVSIMTMVTLIIASILTENVLRDAYNRPKSEWQVIQRKELSSTPAIVRSGELQSSFFQMRCTTASGYSAPGITFDVAIQASMGEIRVNHFPLVLNTTAYEMQKYFLTPHVDGATEFTTDEGGILHVRNLTFAGATADVTMTLTARSGSTLSEEAASSIMVSRVFRLVNDITSVERLAGDDEGSVMTSSIPLPSVRYRLSNAKGQPLARRECKLFTSSFSYPGSEDQRKIAIFSSPRAISDKKGVATFKNVFMSSASSESHMLMVFCGGFTTEYNTLPWRLEDEVESLEWVDGPNEMTEGSTAKVPYRIRVLDQKGNPLAGKHVFAHIAQELGLEYSVEKPHCVLCTVPSGVDSWGNVIPTLSKQIQNPVSLLSDQKGIATFESLRLSVEGSPGKYLLEFSSGKASLRAPQETFVKSQLFAATTQPERQLQLQNVSGFQSRIMDPSVCSPNLRPPSTSKFWNGGVYDPEKVYSNCDGSVLDVPIIFLSTLGPSPSGKILIPFVVNSYVGLSEAEKEDLASVTLAFAAKPSQLHIMMFNELRVTSSDNGTHVIGLRELHNNQTLGEFMIDVHMGISNSNDVFCSNVRILEENFPRVVNSGAGFVGNITVLASNYHGTAMQGRELFIFTSKSSGLKLTSAVTNMQGVAVIPLIVDFVWSRESLLLKIGAWEVGSTAPCSSDWISLTITPTIGKIVPVNLASHEASILSPIILSGNVPQVPSIEMKLLNLDGNQITSGEFAVRFEVISYPGIYVNYPNYNGIQERCIPLPFSEERCLPDPSSVFFQNVSSSWNENGLLRTTCWMVSDAPGWFLLSITVDGIRMDRAISISYHRTVTDIIVQDSAPDEGIKTLGADILSGLEVQLVHDETPVEGLRARIYVSPDHTSNFDDGNWAIYVLDKDCEEGCPGGMVNLVMSEPSDGNGIARFPGILLAAGNPCGIQSLCDGVGKMSFRFNVFNGSGYVHAEKLLEYDVRNPIKLVDLLEPPASLVSPAISFVQQPKVQLELNESLLSVNSTYIVTANPTSSPAGADKVLSLGWKFQIVNPVLRIPLSLSSIITFPVNIACCFGVLTDDSNEASFEDMTIEFLKDESMDLPAIPIDGEYALRFCALGLCSDSVSMDMRSTADHLSILKHSPSTGFIEFPLSELKVKATVGGGVPIAKQRIYVQIHSQFDANCNKVRIGDFRRGQFNPLTLSSETSKGGIAKFNLILLSGAAGTYVFEFFTIDGVLSAPSKSFEIKSFTAATNILTTDIPSKILLSRKFLEPIRVGGTVVGSKEMSDPAFTGATVRAVLDLARSGNAMLAGDIEIADNKGIATFTNLRFVSGRSGTYQIFFVIQGVRSEAFSIEMNNPVEVDTGALGNWWLLAIPYLLFSLPLLAGNNTRNPKMFMHCGACWSFAMLVVLLLIVVLATLAQTEILERPDPFFAVTSFGALVAATCSVYFYVEIAVKEYFVDKANFLTSGKQSWSYGLCCVCCCCRSSKLLESAARLMNIRWTYVDVERGIDCGEFSTREKGTAVLVGKNGYQLIPLEKYLVAAKNLTYYRRKLLYCKYLSHRLMPLGRKRFMENHDLLFKFRKELIAATESPFCLQPAVSENSGRLDEYNLVDRIGKARRHYLLSVRLHQARWKDADPALASLILEPATFIKSLESSSRQSLRNEVLFWEKSQAAQTKRLNFEKKLTNLYQSDTKNLLDSFRSFVLEKYYKFKLASNTPVRRHELYETELDFFYPQRLLISLGMSVVLTLFIFLSGIALARYVAFQVDQAQHQLQAQILMVTDTILTPENMNILQNAGTIFDDLSGGTTSGLSQLTGRETSQLKAIVSFLEVLQRDFSIDSIAKMIKLSVYVGLGVGIFCAALVNYGVWRDFFAAYRKIVLHGHEGSVEIDKYQSLAKITKFLSHYVWHSGIGAVFVLVLVWLFVTSLAILLHPEFGLLEDIPWVTYLTGFIGVSFVVNLILTIILTRYIVNKNVIRHRRVFSWFDLTHTAIALVTGITATLVRFAVSAFENKIMVKM